MNKKPIVSVIGLGKLGCPIAACIAAKGFRVIGVDTNEEVIRKVRALRPPVDETGLADMLQRAGSNITATTDVFEAVLASDISIILVSTPSKLNGEFSLEYVLSVCGKISCALNGWHLVVLVSTVMPGHTGGQVRAALESNSQACGRDFDLCYSPQFVALGSVIHDFMNPGFALIGEANTKSGDCLESFYRQIYENEPPIARMNWVNAELTKLALNAYMTTKITYANLLAKLCERLLGADVDVVTHALGLDPRISPRYFKGALGYAGPCFPRDSLALAALAEGLGVDSSLPETIDSLNRAEPDRLAALIRNQPGDKIGILGLSYKPDTAVTTESQGVLLAQLLTDWTVFAYDPQAKIILPNVVMTGSLDELVGCVDVIVLATPWSEFKRLESLPLDGKTVIDCWRVLDRDKLDCGKYIAVGRGL